MKKFSEVFFTSANLIAIVSIVIAMILCFVNFFVLRNPDVVLDRVSVIGMIIFGSVCVMFQLLHGAGLMKKYFSDELPLIAKIAIHVVFFFLDIFLISALNAALHFLPDYHQAIAQGASRIVIDTIKDQNQEQTMIISFMGYFSIILIGFFCKTILAKKAIKAVA